MSESPTQLLADWTDGDGGPVPLPFPVTPGLIVAVLVAVLVLIVVVAAVGWWGWRRLRRSGQLQRGVLALKATALPPGPQREIAGLRVVLRDDLTHTRQMLAGLATGDRAPDVLTDLLHQLQAIADRVDGRLQLLQHEPDQVFLASALPPLRDRVTAITTDARSLRQTALRWVEDSDEPTRAQAEQDLRDQITGLQAGLAEIRALQPPPGRPVGPTLPGPERGPRA